MDPVASVLIAAAIGALAGLGGSAFGALSSLRVAQLTARASLAPKMHALAAAIVKLRAATNDNREFASRMTDFHVAWHDLSAHQKMLVPSYRIGFLMDIVFRALPAIETHPDAFVDLAGQTTSVVSDMIAAHSLHLFRWRARRAERRLIKEWLEAEKSNLMSNDLRGLITGL